ncbi:hypothetical protein L873DRAFT_1395012 [Choiromyces venosus 120613-1]|uniref:Uncharacterized protein n=1 Tax=Choiromyces venosus 120613-1 TaxID=1336337 RepID=A0A3N4J927_9PEZI|nr:hypothetical protein L873DRAFT_1395012 [Choiromyces venosus 120613-1]
MEKIGHLLNILIGEKRDIQDAGAKPSLANAKGTSFLLCFFVAKEGELSPCAPADEVPAGRFMAKNVNKEKGKGSTNRGRKHCAVTILHTQMKKRSKKKKKLKAKSKRSYAQLQRKEKEIQKKLDSRNDQDKRIR